MAWRGFAPARSSKAARPARRPARRARRSRRRRARSGCRKGWWPCARRRPRRAALHSVAAGRKPVEQRLRRRAGDRRPRGATGLFLPPARLAVDKATMTKPRPANVSEARVRRRAPRSRETVRRGACAARARRRRAGLGEDWVRLGMVFPSICACCRCGAIAGRGGRRNRDTRGREDERSDGQGRSRFASGGRRRRPDRHLIATIAAPVMALLARWARTASPSGRGSSTAAADGIGALIGIGASSGVSVGRLRDGAAEGALIALSSRFR